MRHAVFGKKLSRSSNARKQLRRNLVVSIITHKKIVTTLTKAKSVQPLIEQLVTKAKVGTDVKKREIYSELGNENAAKELVKFVSTLPARTGGYTKIIKLGVRRGDNATEVIFMFVDAPETKKEEAPPRKGSKELTEAMSPEAKIEKTSNEKKLVKKTPTRKTEVKKTENKTTSKTK